MTRIFLSCAVCAALFSGCSSLGLRSPFVARPKQSVQSDGSPEKAWNSSPVLYTRDGTPVGASTPSGPSPHDVSDGESGRTYILELYQEAVEARDSLQLEVTSLHKELAREQSSVQLKDEELRIASERITQLELEREQLLQQNLTLAGRLTNAQVRRLQAEKLLLESRLHESQDAPETEGERP